jgi:hypothetical protein
VWYRGIAGGLQPGTSTNLLNQPAGHLYLAPDPPATRFTYAAFGHFPAKTKHNMNSRRYITFAALVAAAATAACNKDKPEDTPGSSAAMDSTIAQMKRRQALADSVVKAAPSTKEVVDQLGGNKYEEADGELKDAMLKESEKTRDCYTNVRRDIDANLTAVLYVVGNFGAAGWDIIRVEKWNNSSEAGNAVVSCINQRAKAEWKLPVKGVKPGAHVVKLVYTPPDSSKGRD